MNRENIIEIVEKNLYRLCVGQTFPTETALYRFLEIPMEKADGNKTVKAVVSLYVKWEKTGSLNRTGNPSTITCAQVALNPMSITDVPL